MLHRCHGYVKISCHVFLLRKKWEEHTVAHYHSKVKTRTLVSCLINIRCHNSIRLTQTGSYRLLFCLCQVHMRVNEMQLK